MKSARDTKHKNKKGKIVEEMARCLPVMSGNKSK